LPAAYALRSPRDPDDPPAEPEPSAR